MGPLRRQLVERLFNSIDQEKRGSLNTEKLSKIEVI